MNRLSGQYVLVTRYHTYLERGKAKGTYGSEPDLELRPLLRSNLLKWMPTEDHTHIELPEYRRPLESQRSSDPARRHVPGKKCSHILNTPTVDPERVLCEELFPNPRGIIW